MSNDTLIQLSPIGEQAERVGAEVSSLTLQILDYVRHGANQIGVFITLIFGKDGWLIYLVNGLVLLAKVVWEAAKLYGNYDTVFQMPVGDYLTAYTEAVRHHKESLINSDYIQVITMLMLLVVIWDSLYDTVVGRLPKMLRSTLFTHRIYSYTAKIYPALISLTLLPYIVYIYTCIYNPKELNTLSLMFPPSHPLFPVCILINLVCIFYLSFKYIRAGFDRGSKMVSICFMMAVFGCFFKWYESMHSSSPTKYFFPYKVLFKYSLTRVFVYIYMFDLAVAVYMCVVLTIFLFKTYHRRFSNKKPSRDDQ